MEFPGEDGSHALDVTPWPCEMGCGRDATRADIRSPPKTSSRTNLQIRVLFVGQGHLGGLVHLRLVLLEDLVVDLHLGRGQGGGGNEFLKIAELTDARGSREAKGTYQLRVADQLASEPQEGLLEVVVGLGGDVVVLQVLLAVEGDGLGLHLTLLDIDLVTGEDDGDVLADTDEVT